MSQPAVPSAGHAWYAGGPWRLTGYVYAVAAVAAATLVAWTLAGAFAPTNLIMVYLLAVVAVAGWAGRGPATLAVILGVAAFDFFFVPPPYSLAVADTQYLLTFAVMLLVGLTISGLTARIRRQAEVARRRERDTAALAAMSQELAEVQSAAEVAAIACRHVGDVFSADVAVLLRDGAGADLRVSEQTPTLTDDDHAAARWVLEHRERAGIGTPRALRGTAAYVPLLGGGTALGVVCVRPRPRRSLASPETFRLLETCVAQTSLALERVRLADDARAARLRAETERLRSALLTSVSHDLRTPLATITGAATTMLHAGPLDGDTQRGLLESIREEAERLNRLVQNLLDMTRLEAGALRLRREWHPLEEVVGAALGRLDTRLGARRVLVHMPADLPLVHIDDVLIEQVLINLLDNALKYTPEASPLRIAATASGNGVTVEVADRGPGLPRGGEERIFEKFYRVDGAGIPGVGLGLAICRGIVEAHGGRIWAHTVPEGGAAFFFRLPLTDPPPVEAPVDA